MRSSARHCAGAGPATAILRLPPPVPVPPPLLRGSAAMHAVSRLLMAGEETSVCVHTHTHTHTHTHNLPVRASVLKTVPCLPRAPVVNTARPPSRARAPVHGGARARLA